MEFENVLLTLAEIAVAVAGFSGVVGVFGRQHSRGDPRVDATRLRSLVETGLLAAGLCVAPSIVTETGIDPSLAWRLASVLFAASLSASTATSLLRFNRLGRLNIYKRDPVASGFYVLASIAVAVLCANALGAFGSFSPTVYVLCLVSPFGVAILLFLRLLSSHFPTPSV